MLTCSEGHTSTATDYCDVCGTPIVPAVAQPYSPPAELIKSCPTCGAPVSGRFCEDCGHDTALPDPVVQPGTAAAHLPPVSGPAVWVAVVGADREFYERVLARGGPDRVDFPAFFPERRIVLHRNTSLIGRRKPDQGVEPEIDLGIHPADRGVSSQHAVLRIREAGLTVTDLGSTNGTSINGSDDRLNEGVEIPLIHGDRIHVGAWTTIRIERLQ